MEKILSTKFLITDLFKKNNIKRYSRYTSLRAVFAERFNRTIEDHLKKVAFLKKNDYWIDVLPTKTKQYNNQVHSSTKLEPVQASLQKE